MTALLPLLPLLGLAAAPPASAAPRDPFLSWAEVDPPTTFDPLLAANTTDLRVHALLFDPLFRPGDGGWVSDLAAAHVVGPTGTVVVTLRDDLTWHDGAPLTGRDVCATVDRIRAGLGGLAVGRGATWLRLCRDSPSDPTRVEIELAERPVAEPRAALGFPVLPAHVSAEQLAQHPIGTGPMRLAAREGRLIFSDARQPHRDAPAAEVEIAILAHPRAAARALVLGGVDALPEPSPADLPALRAAGCALEWQALRQTWFLVMGRREGPLADVRVRQALTLLLDREALRAAALGVDPDRGEQPVRALDAPFPLDSPLVNLGLPPADVDPHRAAELLESAGARLEGSRWRVGGEPVEIKVGAPEFSWVARNTLERIEGALPMFRVTTEPIPAAAWWSSDPLADRFDLLVAPVSASSDEDPVRFLRDLGLRAGGAGVDPRIERLVEELSAASDEVERNRAGRELHAEVRDAWRWVGLWQIDAWSAARPR